jgi:hypothetical protein
MTHCPPHDLRHFDLVLFSLLFSGPVACRLCDVSVLFVLFYSSFYVLHMTGDDRACPGNEQT